MTDRKKSILYIVCAYLFFWLAVSLIGLALTLAGEDTYWFQEGALFQLMVAFAAWTPTFALFVLFKKLYPDSSIKAFYQNAFRERLNLKLLLCITVIQAFAFFGAVGITAFTQEASLRSLLDLSLSTILMGLLWTALQGATGEQSGWRGFLQPHMEKRFSVIKASVIVGIIVGFWHAPLWFTSGYLGLELLWFILGYMIGIICIALIIGICYHHCRNLFVPIWIHFTSNLFLTIYTGEILATLIWRTALFVPVTIGYVIWHKRCALKSNQHI